MNAAVQNERLAVREKLRDAYRGHLSLVNERLEGEWDRSLQTVEQLCESRPCAAAFEATIRQGAADSMLCYDQNGELSYPADQSPTVEPMVADDAWRAAARLEFVERDFAAAAESYTAIARACTPVETNRESHAWQAAARSHARARRPAAALKILNHVLTQPRFATATDQQGRLIVADSELRCLELLDDASSVDARSIASRLRERLVDYSNPELKAGQRIFLMTRLSEMDANVGFPTLDGERLAARFIESRTSPTSDSVLTATSLPGLWQIATPNRHAVLLFQQTTLDEIARRVVENQPMPDEVSIEIVPPGDPLDRDSVFLTVPAVPVLPDWRLTLTLNEHDVFDSASRARVTSYFWTGTLSIGAIAGLALVIGRSLRNQSRLANLKNDLVATITHELKTPLSSMRLLVDTLIDAPSFDARQVRDYLQLISKENMRLSRLIDNFLAFSRIERNRYRFDFKATDPEAIVEAVVASVHERFQNPDCDFTVHIEPDLPKVFVDADALITVLLNLLDNAYKYSPNPKYIVLRTFMATHDVCFSVEDHGIGMSPREQKRVFRRFYQANQRLSRSSDGCGLGLSIVKYIMDAHDGHIDVCSSPGKGTTVSIKLAKSSEAAAASADAIP